MDRTRRRLLIGALLGGAGLASGIGCSRGRARVAPLDSGTGRKLGVALLGLGGYSRDQLAPALEQTRFCTLRGIVTGTPEKIPVWQRRYGIADAHVYDYGSLPRIANDDAIDVVYVVVPTGLHAKYAVMAAEAGKHVWCEKPMAMSVEECRRIIAACRANRVKLSIGYRMRHEPNTQKVMALASDKPYGAITGLYAAAGYPGGDGRGWRYEKELGGGALYDMGIYAIDAIRYASGDEPLRVTRATQTTTRPEIFDEVDETTDFEVELPSGVRAHGRTSFGEKLNTLRVTCERGWYELSPMQSYSGVEGETSDGQRWPPMVGSQQALQMDDDARAILEGREVMVPGEEGLRGIAILEAIVKAAESGQPQAIERG